MMHLDTLKHKTQEFNTSIYAIYLSYRDSRVGWPVRLLLAFVIGYAISPIDLIPDLIVLFGFLDDVVVVALGLSLSWQMLPKDVVNEARLQAYEVMNKPEFSEGHRIIGYAWILAVTVLAVFVYKILFLNML
ncbi:YkvA family protein [Pontibacter sp. 13R65]|uniref:YkvA family protein n=1 Tax=Pontibacter sp. 13R65 TaxID=3127458 RepID=UPI00301B82F5